MFIHIICTIQQFLGKYTTERFNAFPLLRYLKTSIHPPPTTKIITCLTCLVRNPYRFSGMPPWNPGSQGSKLYRNDHSPCSFFPVEIEVQLEMIWGTPARKPNFSVSVWEAVDIQLPCAMLVNGQLIPPEKYREILMNRGPYNRMSVAGTDRFTIRSS